MAAPLKHKAKKSFGQNFLVDINMRERIILSAELRKEDVVIEIGPGQGALTQLIAPYVKQFMAIEADRDLIPLLKPLTEQHPSLTVIQADFLKWEFENLAAPVKVIGNIPYNISTPIIERLIENRSKISKAFLTVQLEFAQRLVAKPNTSDYGSLSCFVQLYTNPKILFKISKGCFSPTPKVDSAFVELEFKDQLALPQEQAKGLSTMIQTIFTQRRKTMLNALSLVINKEQAGEVLTQLDIASQRRPETLSLDDYIKIYQLIARMKTNG